MKTNNFKLLIPLAGLVFLALFPIFMQANETPLNAITSKRLNEVAGTMHMYVTDTFGRVHYSDVVSVSDPFLNFDLMHLPVGSYTVHVHHGKRVINSHTMKNVTTNPNVITAEILNAEGKQVFESAEGQIQYNLTAHPNQSFTLYVYRGDVLINKVKL